MVSRGDFGGWVLILLALALLMLPMQWVFAVILAAAFHEFCHYGAVRLCGGEVRRLHAGVLGARMEINGLSVGKELLCALAGPVGGLLLLFFARWMPRTAICAASHALFNLLPVYPLDGGRALRCGVELLLPVKTVDKICNLVERGCLTCICLLGLYGTFVLHLGLLPVLFSLSLGMRVWCAKIPCKERVYSVQ